MQTITLNHDQARLVRYAVHPQTPPFEPSRLADLYRSLLAATDVAPKRIETLVSGLLDHLAEGGMPVLMLESAVRAIRNEKTSAFALARFVLAIQGAKYDLPSDIDALLGAFRKPLPCFSSEADQERYRYGWLRKVTEFDRDISTITDGSATARIERLLDLGSRRQGDRALSIYSELTRYCRFSFSPLQKERMITLGAKTGESMVIVVKNIAESDSSVDTRARRKAHGMLELPLPIPRLSRTADEITHTLKSEFPWLVATIESLQLELLVCEHYRRGIAKLSPRLLFGPPGTGKTSLVARVAELIGLPFTLLSATSGSSKVLVGSARGWSGSRCCLPIEVMSQNRVPACAVLLDELDKETVDNRNGRISDALLNLTEPETASKYFDENLLASCDLTYVSWFATANRIDELPEPLLSRFELIYCPQPALEHRKIIVERTLNKLRREFGLDPSVEMLDRQAATEIDVLTTITSTRALNHLVRSKFGETVRRRFTAKASRTSRVAQRMH